MTDATMSCCWRTDGDEDDVDWILAAVDKMLAEIGEGPSKPIEPRPEEEKVDPEPELGVQSAAAKKKKKKKEKEKEKKAAVVEKVLKAVRERKDAIARRIEAKEELRRQEELERQAEEARGMAATKEQLLTQSNLPSVSDTATSGPTKRHLYQTKKSKQTHHQEPEKSEEAEPVSADNGSCIDDVNISVSSSFTEEEEAADSELRFVSNGTGAPASSKPTGSLKKAEVKPQEVQCKVLEVKVVEGHGTTIDVELVNGVLHEGDQIVICGLQGPIVTTIRALLTPHPMKELRVKGSYLHHKEIKAAGVIKISAQGLEHAVSGAGLYVLGPEDNLEHVKEVAMDQMRSFIGRINKSREGVRVQASTLGSLEALLVFLKSPEVSIPVSSISIGPVHKKDVIKASVMLEKKKEHAIVLAFDVEVTPEAQELADELGVKVFRANNIYHLFDQFKAHIDSAKKEKKKGAAKEAVCPCVLTIVPGKVFNKKDPIVLGVEVFEGTARVGTPLCIPQRDYIFNISRIASIESNNQLVDVAHKGQTVAIKIVGTNLEEKQKMFGWHFGYDDILMNQL